MIERFHHPSSRTPRWLSLSLFDTTAAMLTPLAALQLHHAVIAPGALTAENMAHYAAISVLAALAAFATFRVSDGLSRFFSLADAVRAAKAVIAAAAASVLCLFLADRLAVLPASLLVLNVALLGLAVLSGRAVARFLERRGKPVTIVGRQNALLVGCNRLADAYIAILEANPGTGVNIAALVDPAGRLVGRTIRGYPIAGSLPSLSSLVDEYKVHGVGIDRIMVAVPRRALPPIDLAILTAECARIGLEPEFLDERLGLLPQAPPAECGDAVVKPIGARPELVAACDEPSAARSPVAEPGAYHGFKRALDFLIALALVAVTLPLSILVAGLVLADVGAPLLFWQRRVGHRGRRFVVYKFRTFHAPYDRFGNPRLERAELSRIGAWLRRTRLDELPQLYNVLIGDMSIIGPRPLLDIDLPENDERRLAVRPGLTGWAQVNGGKLLSVEDKNLLDCWYIANASLLLDMKVLVRTVGMMLFGERDNPEALTKARAQVEGHGTSVPAMLDEANVSMAA
jgi:lipopolysaccharide/colanic/teichoic acid biosynthesis glycosyltransferase